ncbi:MAG: hypothetical protein FJX56_11035 [Alphaproteobacteria bacterium]|nr:hypothetical protein [Alphaproteobacteria bacterium]
MRRTLEDEFGVPVRWVEDKSRTTFDNAQPSYRLLAPEGIKTILLVTHAWHMPRAAEAFARVGFAVVAAPTAFTYVGPGIEAADFVPSANAFQNSYYAAQEWIGLYWYRLFEY